MKAIIAEIRGNHMIVIAKNGDFSRCKKLPNCNIGDEINIPERNMRSIYKNLSAVAASFLILIMLSSGVYAYYTPYSYVSVDINPSLELYVNRFDRVIGVHAFNDEAEQVIKSSEGIKNENVSVALEEILDNAEKAGYLSKDAENSVMIVVSSGNKKEETALIDKMSKTSTAVLSSINSNYEIILEKTNVENYKKAKEQNVSPGKVMLADRFKEAKPEIDKEEIKHMPLQQAIKQIEKKADKEVVPNKAITTMEKPNQKPNQKPKEKSEPKNKVMNIKELIKEKNEELSDKLEKDKDKNEGDDKTKGNDKDIDKDDESKAKDNMSIDQDDDKIDQKDGQDKEPSKENHDDKIKEKDNKK
ncbi:MAG: hypothetical protein K0S75_2137 [Clostridia bacterium]|jgi:hypothetical protein|nr:hypothetical protein [Clostridia bacterium]